MNDDTHHLSPSESLRLLTVGHSNHTLDHLLSLLRRHDVEILADVRSAPYSRYSSQFNRDNLAGFLQNHAIRYHYLGGKLGGRPDDPECYDEAGHVIYDVLESTATYKEGIGEVDWLLREGRRVCLMCSEEDPAICHRALSIGHVLSNLGVEVLHIRRDGRLQAQSELDAKAAGEPQQATLFEATPLRKSVGPAARERGPTRSLET
jgi:uncharacterized protein (DUF488 family)